MVVVGATPPSLPATFPTALLTLLGISGSSYLVSKAIQAGSPDGVTRPTLSLSAPPAGPVQTATFTVTLLNAPTGTPMPALHWSLGAPAPGTITAIGPDQARYNAPVPSPGGQATVIVKADGFEDGTAAFTI